MSDDSDDIDAALQARAAQGKQDSDTDDIDAALRARAKQTTPATDTPPPAPASSNPFIRHAQSDLSDAGALSDATVTSILNAPHKAWEGTKDLFSRITGQGPITKTEGPAKLEDSTKETLAPGDIPTYLHGKVSDAAKALETASPTGFNILQHTGDVLGDVGDIAQVAPLASPLIGGARKLAGASLFDTAAAPALSTADAAQAAASKAASARSGGAAGVAIDTSKLKSDTQAALAKAYADGQEVDHDALARIAKAESVGVDLTEGQAKNDSGIKSNEFNNKNADNNAVGDRFNRQDEALTEKLSDLHREAAPTAVGNDEIQNGHAIIEGLKDYDAPKKQAINDAYQAAKDANGGDLQMDGSKFTDAAEAALKPQGRFRSLTPVAQGILDDVKASGGKMSLDDFEGYRTQLAAEARANAADGNKVAAINKVRDALEDTPPAGDASVAAKKAYDKARGLAKARFQEIDADPAYKAAVEDDTPKGELSPLADKFTSKYVKNAPRANLQQLRAKLAGSQEADEAMTSSTFNELRNKSEKSKGFSQDAFNTAFKNVESKPELINNPEHVDTLRDVGEVGKMVQVQKRGDSFNNAHTSHALQAAARVGSSLPGRGVAAFIPGGTEGVNLLKHLADKNAAFSSARSLAPGAGLTK